MTIRAYSYIRFSTVEQRKGDSLRRQLKRTEEYAAKHGLVLDDRSFRDLGVSAFTGENVETGRLSEFLAAVRSGAIEKGSYLLIENLDRLSRQSVLNALGILSDIVKAGIVVITMTDERRYDSASLNDTTVLMMAVLTFARANEESQLKSDRVGGAWRKKKADAVASKKPLTKRCPAWLRIAPNGIEYEEIEKRGDIVRRIFADSARGLGSSAIVRQLNAEGLPSFGKEGEWQRSYITKLLQNDAVLGRFRPHSRPRGGKRVATGEIVEAYFPETVTPQLWQEARSGRVARRHRSAGRRGQKFKNLFTGLCRCGACNGSMELRDKGAPPKGGIYLTCASALRGGACNERTHYPYERFEALFLDHVRDLDFPSIQQGASIELRHARSQTADFEQSLFVLEERKQRLLDALEGGDDPDILGRIRRNREESAQLKAKLLTNAETVQRLLVQEKSASRNYLVETRGRMEKADGVELFNIRAELAQALRSAIAGIEFNTDFIEVAIDTSAMAIGYRFMASGEVRHVSASKKLPDWYTDLVAKTHGLT